MNHPAGFANLVFPLLFKEGKHARKASRFTLSGKEGNRRKPAGFLLFVTFRSWFRGNQPVSSCS